LGPAEISLFVWFLDRGQHRRRQGYAPICPGIPKKIWPKNFFTRPNCPSPWSCEGGSEVSELVSFFPATQPPALHEQPRTLAPRRLGIGGWALARGDGRTGKAQGATAGRARARGAGRNDGRTGKAARGSSSEAASSLHRPPFYSHEGEQQLHSSFTQLSTPVLRCQYY
jgi:hypothetical protein